MSSTNVGSAPAAAPKKKYVRAVGPRLRKLLYLIFVLVAILFANSGYLATITFLEWYSGETYQGFFYQRMFLVHLAVGLLLIVPLIVFAFTHMWISKDRRNRRAIRIGYALLAISMIVLATGFLLMRVSGFDLKEPYTRNTVYWLHVACPLAAVWLYWLHRLAGPRIKWRVGLTFGGLSIALIAIMVAL